MEWLDGYNQTFTTLSAETGSTTYTMVYWDTDVGMWWQGEFIKPINHYSYASEDDGIAHTVLGPWEIIIGDTITLNNGLTVANTYCSFGNSKISLRKSINNTYDSSGNIDCVSIDQGFHRRKKRVHKKVG